MDNSRISFQEWLRVGFLAYRMEPRGPDYVGLLIQLDDYLKAAHRQGMNYALIFSNVPEGEHTILRPLIERMHFHRHIYLVQKDIYFTVRRLVRLTQALGEFLRDTVADQQQLVDRLILSMDELLMWTMRDEATQEDTTHYNMDAKYDKLVVQYYRKQLSDWYVEQSRRATSALFDVPPYTSREARKLLFDHLSISLEKWTRDPHCNKMEMAEGVLLDLFRMFDGNHAGVYPVEIAISSASTRVLWQPGLPIGNEAMSLYDAFKAYREQQKGRA